MSKGKVLDLAELARRSRQLRSEGKCVVLCHGTFDLMHTGHIRHLQRAREEGDVLLVTITADDFVNKGPGRPVFNQHLRAETIAALECVDFVGINYAASAVEALQEIRPNVYVKGGEYRYASEDVTGNIAREQSAVEAFGGQIFFTDEITFSSSNLLNSYFEVFPQEVREFLQEFRKLWSEQVVREMIASLANLKVLVVGDAIIDQYHYTTPLGQTGKGSFLAVRFDAEEQFAGGSIAVANHIAGFAGKVTLLTGLGVVDSHEPFIRQKLLHNVEPLFAYFPDAPTVTKRRFVDADLAKFFEVYFYKDNAVSGNVESELCQWLEKHTQEFDAVVVPDFGNGFITPSMIEILSSKARFLAVNTQINSGNRGYHVISRYPRVDFVSLNEPEIRLAAHNRFDSLEAVAELVGERVHAKHVAVTRGTRGVLMYDRCIKAFHQVPALATRVVDRVGAGDAFLSLAGLCVAKGLDARVAAFVGSVAAAMDVQIVCNRDPINFVALNKYVSTLLK